MNDYLLTKCCECGRIREDIGWRWEVEDLRQQATYSHTYCPICLDIALQRIDAMEVAELKDAG